MKYLILIILSLLTTSCATRNYVKQFYEQNPNLDKIEKGLLPWSEEITIINASSDAENQWKESERRGFDPIGGSNFLANSPYNPVPFIKKHGIKIEADLSVWSMKYKDTMTGTRPTYAWDPGTTSTTSTSGNVNSDTSGFLTNTNGGNTHLDLDGNSQFTGQSTTTTEGRMILTGTESYSIERNSYSVVYYRKSKPRKLGTNWGDITDALKKELGTNSGMMVRIVRYDSPAYRADIFEGDVLLEINGEKIYKSNVIDLANKHSGKTVNFKIYRDGKTINKEVKLDQ